MSEQLQRSRQKDAADEVGEVKKERLATEQPIEVKPVEEQLSDVKAPLLSDMEESYRSKGAIHAPDETEETVKTVMAEQRAERPVDDKLLVRMYRSIGDMMEKRRLTKAAESAAAKKQRAFDYGHKNYETKYTAGMLADLKNIDRSALLKSGLASELLQMTGDLGTLQQRQIASYLLPIQHTASGKALTSAGKDAYAKNRAFIDRSKLRDFGQTYVEMCQHVADVRFNPKLFNPDYAAKHYFELDTTNTQIMESEKLISHPLFSTLSPELQKKLKLQNELILFTGQYISAIQCSNGMLVNAGGAQQLSKKSVDDMSQIYVTGALQLICGEDASGLNQQQAMRKFGQKVGEKAAATAKTMEEIKE